MKVEFSVAEEKDLQEIINMFHDAIEEMNKHNIHQWDEVYPDEHTIENDIRNKQLYVGKIHSEIACVYVVNDECDEEYTNGDWKYPNATYAVIHRMCVNPKFQNQGIGAVTLNHIEEKLKDEGVETIRLDAFSLNPFALKLYYKNGYVKVGVAILRKGKFYLMEKKI